jgi:hypothetical protein
MDDFSLDRPELTGSLISMEFGQGGRIQQLWTADPQEPEGEEFQFVCSPIPMGDEFTDDYFPGTILLGARSGPDEPWVLSRNANAVALEDEDSMGSAFEYEFSFLEDIRATGRFFEMPGTLPQICWEVSIRNRSRRSIEIGELAFPFALNNVYEGFPRNDKGLQEMWNDRVYIHKFIGGAASYLFAQRLTARPPGLLIFPGDETRWEFYNHVPASLHTPYRWEGIPVVYVHSRAAIEREGWGEWFLGHTSLILEPGETRVYETRFAPAERNSIDGVSTALQNCRRPAIKLFPAAVAPAEVGIAMEVTGATPTRFFSDVECDLETDADEEGGFCFVRPNEPGAIRLMFEDTEDRLTEAHLLFTEPIEQLIQARARWIVENQIVDSGQLSHAILATDNTNEATTEPYGSDFAIVSSLADALFLAEKNTLYPTSSEIKALDAYLDSFVERLLRNPSDGATGGFLAGEGTVAIDYGRPLPYLLCALTYQAMARIAASFGETRRSRQRYLRLAAETAITLFRQTSFPSPSGVGVPLMSYLPELVDDLEAADLVEEAAMIISAYRQRERDVARRRNPSVGETLWHTTGYDESFWVAHRRGDSEAADRAIRCAFAARSLSPCWWWYGSDKMWSEYPFGPDVPSIEDKGEICLGSTTVANSLMMLATLDRDHSGVSETYLRMAFGGLLGVWALVRPDGAGSMGYCPDAASRQFGMSWYTGDLGISLFHYLRRIACFVLPQPGVGLSTFGCTLEVDNETEGAVYIVRPWDGVGRRVVLRHIGFEASVDVGNITEVRIEAMKREASVSVRSLSGKQQSAKLAVRGMWGRRLGVNGSEHQVQDGVFVVPLALPAEGTMRVDLRVIE